jgi:hypothetical protein
MIVDIKVGILKRKSLYVAGGYMIDAPVTITYASVVSQESVQLGLLMNGLSILLPEIQNAYLTSPSQELIYTVLGPEFGPGRH